MVKLSSSSAVDNKSIVFFILYILLSWTILVLKIQTIEKKYTITTKNLKT